MRPCLLVLPVLVAAGLTGCSGSSRSSGLATPTSGPSTASVGGPSATSTLAAAPAQSAVSAEQNPPGDIPDNLAFVPYANPAGRYSFSHPEGWAQTGHGPQVLFTDKLNGVEVQPGAEKTARTATEAQAKDVPALQRSQAAFELRSVKAVTVPGGSGVDIVYRRNSAADPVTGRQYRDEVQRYELVTAGREVVMELFGPVGADNVDAYRTMVQSLRLK